MLAVAGGKGGAGKTTTALGLAAAMTRSGPPVLVVDTDRDMPDLHAVAETPGEPGLGTLADADDAVPVRAVTHESRRFPGVYVVPADGCRRPSDALAELVDDRPTILDCPAGAGRDAARPLRLADRSLLVSAPTERGLRDTAKTAAMSRAVGTEPAGVILTRTDDRPDLGDLFDCPLLGSIPRGDAPALDDPSVRSAYRNIVRTTNLRNI